MDEPILPRKSTRSNFGKKPARYANDGGFMVALKQKHEKKDVPHKRQRKRACTSTSRQPAERKEKEKGNYPRSLADVPAAEIDQFTAPVVPPPSPPRFPSPCPPTLPTPLQFDTVKKENPKAKLPQTYKILEVVSQSPSTSRQPAEKKNKENYPRSAAAAPVFSLPSSQCPQIYHELEVVSEYPCTSRQPTEKKKEIHPRSPAIAPVLPFPSLLSSATRCPPLLPAPLQLDTITEEDPKAELPQTYQLLEVLSEPTSISRQPAEKRNKEIYLRSSDAAPVLSLPSSLCPLPSCPPLLPTPLQPDTIQGKYPKAELPLTYQVLEVVSETPSTSRQPAEKKNKENNPGYPAPVLSLPSPPRPSPPRFSPLCPPLLPTPPQPDTVKEEPPKAELPQTNEALEVLSVTPIDLNLIEIGSKYYELCVEPINKKEVKPKPSPVPSSSNKVSNEKNDTSAKSSEVKYLFPVHRHDPARILENLDFLSKRRDTSFVEEYETRVSDRPKKPYNLRSKKPKILPEGPITFTPKKKVDTDFWKKYEHLCQFKTGPPVRDGPYCYEEKELKEIQFILRNRISIPDNDIESFDDIHAYHNKCLAAGEKPKFDHFF